MFLGQVVGNLVASIKISCHKGKKLLLVQPVDALGLYSGPVGLALDAAGAGIGDYVLCSNEGTACRMALADYNALTDCAILGILDHLPG